MSTDKLKRVKLDTIAKGERPNSTINRLVKEDCANAMTIAYSVIPYYICSVNNNLKTIDMPTIDFGYGAQPNAGSGSTTGGGTATETKTDITTGQEVQLDENGNPITAIEGGVVPVPEPDDKGDKGDKGDKDDKNKPADKPADKPKEDDKPAGIDVTKLEAGTSIEVDGASYLVDAVGNLVDSEGNIFKKADEVADYLAQFETDDTDGNEAEIDIDSIQKAIGVEIVDDKGKKVKFDSTPEGVAAYVKSVIEVQEDEIREATVNRLYQDFPILEDVINYYVANGNSLEGFNELPDRSGIVIDENNEAQLVGIIKQAFKEFGKRGDVNKYIQYLKDSGQLVDVAKDELAALQQADKEAREEIEAKAAEAAKAAEEESIAYWSGVEKVVNSKKIAGYQIPDNIIIERDGKKISATPKDFFNYMYQVDENGVSRYQHDLKKMSPESRRDDQILRAYLTFVGGNYGTLVDMAIKDKEVKNLRLKSVKTTTKGIKVTPPQSKTQSGKIDVGYN